MKRKILSLILALTAFFTFAVTAGAAAPTVSSTLVDTTVKENDADYPSYISAVLKDGSFTALKAKSDATYGKEPGDFLTKVNQNSNTYITVKNASGNDISMLEKNNVTVVSFQINTNGATGCSIKLQTSQSATISPTYVPSNWSANEWHTMTYIYYPVIESNNNYTVNTDLYIDGVYTDSYTDTKALETYKYSQLRLAVVENADYFLDDIKVLTINQFTAPEISVTDGCQIAVKDNKIYGYTGKTVADIKRIVANSSVYSGNTLAADSALVSNDMTVRIKADYTSVIGLSFEKKYDFAAADTPVVLKNYVTKESNYRQAHTFNIDANKATNNAWADGIVYSNTETTNYGYLPIGSDNKNAVFETEKNPIVFSIDINPFAGTATGNIENFAFYSGNTSAFNNRISSLVTMSDLTAGSDNNITMIYYPMTDANGAFTDDGTYCAYTDTYINGKFFGRYYVTKWRGFTGAGSNEGLSKFVITKTNQNNPSSCAVKNIRINSFNKLSMPKITSDKCTVEESTINGWYSLDKTGLKDALTGSGITMPDTIQKGAEISVTVDYTAVENGLRSYTKTYTLGEKFGKLTSLSMGTNGSLSVSTEIFVKDAERLSAALNDESLDKYTMLIACYKEDNTLINVLMQRDVKIGETMEFSPTLPTETAKVRGFIFNSTDNLVPALTSTENVTLSTEENR